jgi:hypothetical protein
MSQNVTAETPEEVMKRAERAKDLGPEQMTAPAAERVCWPQEHVVSLGCRLPASAIAVLGPEVPWRCIK